MQVCIEAAYLLLFLAEHTELEVNVIELPAKGTTGSLHRNCAALEGHLDCKNKIYENSIKTFRPYTRLSA